MEWPLTSQTMIKVFSMYITEAHACINLYTEFLCNALIERSYTLVLKMVIFNLEFWVQIKDGQVICVELDYSSVIYHL